MAPSLNSCYDLVGPLLGQEEAEQAFLSAWRANRLSHAWLIEGPKGIGKARLAHIIAAYLLVDQTPPLMGTCFMDLTPPPAALIARMAANSDPDFLRILPEKESSEINITAARAAIRFAQLTPHGQGFRVILVDSVCILNRNALNALLKLIEEPPPSMILLLICHERSRLPPTLTSRCRRLRAHPLELNHIEKIMVTLGYDPTLAPLSEGSAGLACLLAENQDAHDALLDWMNDLPEPSPDKLDNLASHWTSASDFLVLIFDRILARAARAAATHIWPSPFHKKEQACIQKLAKQHGAFKLLEAREKVLRTLAESKDLTLDREQAAWVLFRSLQKNLA